MKQLYNLSSATSRKGDTSLEEAEKRLEKSARFLCGELSLLALESGRTTSIDSGFGPIENKPKQKEFFFELRTASFGQKTPALLSITFKRNGMINIDLSFREYQDDHPVQSNFFRNIDGKTFRGLDEKIRLYFSGKPKELLSALHPFSSKLKAR